MIDKEDVLETAKEKGVNPIIIEKDYVLGWLLAAINMNPVLKKEWVFKGGTCLKKCFFHDYRFSEDLDFSITQEGDTDVKHINANLVSSLTSLYELSGIETHEMILQPFPDQEGKTLTGKISYVGPLQQKGSLTRIKLDLTQKEIICSGINQRDIFHPYEDFENDLFKITPYSYEEIFAEKLRALFQRTRPRDLYDVIYLYERRKDFSLNESTFRNILKKKFFYKRLENLYQNPILPKDSIDILHQEWTHMLAHQLSDLQPPDEYVSKLTHIIEWAFHPT